MCCITFALSYSWWHGSGGKIGVYNTIVYKNGANVKPVVSIVDRVYNRSKDDFDAADDLQFIPVDKAESEVAKSIKTNRACAVVLATDKYENELYTSFHQAGLIARYGVGHDNIDNAKATDNNLFVTITPGVLDNSVAEHAIFLMGTLSRKISTSDNAIKANQWNKSIGTELCGSILLIVGCGNIGRKVAKIAAAGFDMKVLGFDAADLDANKMQSEYKIEMLSLLDEGLYQADFISLHLPAIEATKDFINADFLSKLKDDCAIINTSRGCILDENALYDELSKGRLFVALDVYKNEPYTPHDPSKDLRTLHNIVMTPHISSSTHNASKRMAELVIKNIRAYLNKDFTSMDIVNTEVNYYRLQGGSF